MVLELVGFIIIRSYYGILLSILIPLSLHYHKNS